MAHNTHDQITVIGAREHNLKNISVTIPKNKLIIITGPSGSGKSTLALDVLYAEGKRRYMESLSSYARQFLGITGKPDVEAIYGLCPAIAIEQKTVSQNPRSTVGTITEIYDYLRVLFARIGIAHCPTCSMPVKAESADSVVRIIIQKYNDNTIIIAAPLVQQKKGEFTQELIKLFQQGFYRFKIDGTSYKFSSIDEIQSLHLVKNERHTIDLLIDALDIHPSVVARLTEAVETAFAKTEGICKVIAGTTEQIFSSEHICVTCGQSIPELEPRLFSFNSPLGACKRCNGIGFVYDHSLWGPSFNKDDYRSHQKIHHDVMHLNQTPCTQCNGERLNNYARHVTVGDYTIIQLSRLSLADLYTTIQKLPLNDTEQEIAASLLKEIQKRNEFLINVGLSYLTLERPAYTLSGGEGQRIRLATQIGSALSGILYVLDEPSIGLHQRDNEQLINTLCTLRDTGNTVVVVEHDLDTIAKSDYVIDMGPRAGVLGGNVTAAGTPNEIARNPDSLTGQYLSGTKSLAIPAQRRKPKRFMRLEHATAHNLKNITVQFPLNVLCAISGVSGSGKSSLIMQELVPAIMDELGGYSRTYNKKDDTPFQGTIDFLRNKTATITDHTKQSRLTGAESIKNLVIIDQTPIGKMPRSNPATYLGIFDHIRKLYASVPESNARNYTVGRFSFNVSDGWCPICKGDGMVTIEMHFLPPVHMVCKECKGKRYNRQTLEIRFKGKNIADVLEMTVYEAYDFFKSHTPIAKKLEFMIAVGLDYLKLGQPSPTLSGGEAQRIKLVDELAKRGNDTVYLLDEPTTGLHTDDIGKLLIVLNQLVDKGNSIIIIEHNIDLLKTVDYLIDMGPEGGALGGMVVAAGTPEEVAECTASKTAPYLRK